jgi:hypothetical protein
MAKHRTNSTEFKRLPRNTLRARLFGVLRAQLRPERVGARPVRHLGTPPSLAALMR